MPRGGARPGAGRPKGRFSATPHRRRLALDARHPVHVVLRVDPYLELRQRSFYNAMRTVLDRYVGVDGFRIVHVSIQSTHVHLVVEAENKDALTRHMQSFAIVAARAINRARKSTGKVFTQRYHARQVHTRRQARNLVEYVLNNWRHHRCDLTSRGRRIGFPVDPFSSGVTFDGWNRPIDTRMLELRHEHTPLATSPPRTTLLALVRDLDPYHCPGSSRDF